MSFLWDIFYFVIIIGILVLIHEFGHFIAARLTGMRADVFSIGMGMRLFGYNKQTGFSFGKLEKAFKKKGLLKEGQTGDDIDMEGQTDYRISLFPIGGYVKIAGMVDESMDTGYNENEPKPWEFRSKKTWQKAIVLSAGVIMNVVLAIGIFAGIFYFQGKSMYATTEIGYVKEDSFGEYIGLKEGDKVLSVNNNEVSDWQDFIQSVTLRDLGGERSISILRSGETKTLEVSGDEVVKRIANNPDFGIEPAQMKTYVMAAINAKPAAEAGIKSGDTVLTMNGEPVNSVSEFIDIVHNNKSKPVNISVGRDGEIFETVVTPSEEGKVGVQVSNIYTGKVNKVEFGIFESLGLGVNQTVETVDLFISSIGQIFKGNIAFKESVGGPIMIAKQASQHAERGLISFLSFMALLSISLAIINILPFPALDGGHLVFTVVEGVMGKEVPLKIKMAIQQTGIVVLLLFMAFVIYNDIVR
ncbi:MAG: RIP metalloprotease RseP [Candidatus Kapaibacterium sp.]